MGFYLDRNCILLWLNVDLVVKFYRECTCNYVFKVGYVR